MLALRPDRFWVRNIYIYRDPYEAGPDQVCTSSTGTWWVEDDALVLEWHQIMGDSNGQEVFQIVSAKDSRLVLEAANGDRLDLTRGAGDIEPGAQADLDEIKRDVPLDLFAID